MKKLHMKAEFDDALFNWNVVFGRCFFFFFFFFFFFSLLLIARPQAFLDAVDKP